MSDVLGVNDTDRYHTSDTLRDNNLPTTLSYSTGARAYLDSNVSVTTSPHSKMSIVRGHTSFAEETIRVQLYDGYLKWGEWTDVIFMTSGI